VGHLTPGNPIFDQRLASMAQRFMTNAADSTQLATAALFSSVQRQATMLAYIDIFHWMAIAAACAIPLDFLLRNIELGKG
jgi:DHA2 family multidrug resistance protein